LRHIGVSFTPVFFVVIRERERHVTFQEKREKKGKKKNESPIRLPHDAHSTWFADRLPFVVVVVLRGEEVVKALTLPPSSLGGDEASFISTHMRCVITFLFLRFFVLVDYFLDEFN
jgi:hypothetical protein